MPRLATQIALAVALIFGSILASPVTVAFAPQVNGGSSLIYRTDFENVTKIDTHHLNMGSIEDYFSTATGSSQSNRGASMWMEGLDRNTPGISCHSGGRCVGMEVTNITESRRIQFDIHGMQNLVGNELFVSVWLYLPDNWSLHFSSSMYPGWYELIDPFFTDAPIANPIYGGLYIGQPDISKYIFSSDFAIRNMLGVQVFYGHISNYQLPLGRWFNVQYYVLRDPTNGIVRIWVDGSLLFDIHNVPTEDPSNPQWWTTIGKIYYDLNDTYSPYRLWVDDLAIYNSLPTSTTTNSTSPSSSTMTSMSTYSTTAVTSSTVSSTTTSVSSSTMTTLSSTTTSTVSSTTTSAVAQTVTVTQSAVTQTVTVTQSAVAQTVTVAQSGVIQAVTVTQTVTVTQGASTTQKPAQTTNQPKPPPPSRGRNQ